MLGSVGPSPSPLPMAEPEGSAEESPVAADEDSGVDDRPNFAWGADEMDDSKNPEDYPLDNSDSYPYGLVSVPDPEREYPEWPENRRVHSEQIFILVQLELCDSADLDDLMERVRRSIILVCRLFQKGTRSIESGHMSVAISEFSEIGDARVLVGTTSRPHGNQVMLDPEQLADFAKERIDVDFGSFDDDGSFVKFVPDRV